MSLEIFCIKKKEIVEIGKTVTFYSSLSPSHHEVFLRDKSDHRVMSTKGKEVALPPGGASGRSMGLENSLSIMEQPNLF